MKMQDMEGYNQLLAQLLATLPAEQVISRYSPEQRLASVSPEQRLAGLRPEQVLSHYAPEQRLAGLDRDDQALALPVEVVRLLPEEYFLSLSPEVAAELRRRLRPHGR
jgi:hypothetical protein